MHWKLKRSATDEDIALATQLRAEVTSICERLKLLLDVVGKDGDVRERDGAAADLAREFSHALLDAGDNDGHGGCPLCRS